jgi:membrane protein
MRRRWTRIARLPPVHFVGRVVAGFLKHDDMSLAAAVAFYTALSFAPLVMLVLTFGGVLGESAQGDLIRFFDQQLGPRASEVTQAVVESAQREDQDTSWWRSAISIVLLVVTASGVFGQLQSSLNLIWEAKAPPRSGMWAWLRKRLLSMGMVLAALFILLVSLVLSAVVERIAPLGEGLAARIAVGVASFIVAMLLFAAIFRVLPDTQIAWSRVWLGAATTAALFTVGKLGVGLYLDRSGVTDSYGGAAGALIALLLWVYYSSIILFVGAEITRATIHSQDATPSSRQ